ncbi:MAG: CehA/McbA family metallohydrolase [Deltaproteobacteria bacterium]|nr:CehA/McbA family metallohydrolase [Deltaproteobacteria bacterium]
MNFEVYPKIISVGSEVEISIRGLNAEPELQPNQTYRIHAFSKVNLWEETRMEVKADEDGFLRIPLSFHTRGEYLIDVCEEVADKPFTTAHIFATSPDLVHRKAYRGDLHIHTHYSDGRQSPIFMAVKAKELGLDFIAITDHHKYQPSVEAIEEAEKINLNLSLFTGEEVTVKERGGHILTLCTSDWVSNQKSDSELYDREYRNILLNELKDKTLVEGLTKEKYAHAVWTVNKIREFGGYAVLAHPYWVSGRQFNLNLPIYDQLLEDGLYDAVELLGDVLPEDNILSVVKYYEEIARGRKIPIMGNSDTHRADHTYGHYWTLVFAEKLDQESIFNAIFDLKSVACEHHPGGTLRIYGPFDLVEYAYFLHREFFPLHDKICEREGQLHMRVLEGEEPNRGELENLKMELDMLYVNSWG